MARLLRAVIRRFDAYLCRVYRVYEFTQDPECILRLAPTIARQPLQAHGVTVVQPGEALLEIHLWNEHMTPLNASENSIAWGSRTLRQFKYSLQLAARHVASQPGLAGMRGIFAVTSVLSSEHNSNRPGFMERLGFITLPYHNKLGAFGEFWENFYAWWIMWTYNPLSLRSRRLTGMRRSEMWMPMSDFMQRYG